jgi:hypothetical protein
MSAVDIVRNRDPIESATISPCGGAMLKKIPEIVLPAQRLP